MQALRITGISENKHEFKRRREIEVHMREVGRLASSNKRGVQQMGLLRGEATFCNSLIRKHRQIHVRVYHCQMNVARSRRC